MIFQHPSDLASSGFSPAVCIIGSGPAGIALALQLEKKGIACVIVEAGDFDYAPSVQEAYRGTVIGDRYFNLEGAHLRYFGGTSGHWAGQCRPLDEADFLPRKGYREVGWPIRKKDLDPYADDARAILELDPWPADIAIDPNWNEIHFNYSPPVRFGQKYRQHIAASPHIALLLYSALTDIVPANGAVDHITITSPDGKQQQLKAPLFCLCTGGISNSRLLLWANQLHNGAVVANASTLGKYWMEHNVYGAGAAVISNVFSWRSDAHDGVKHFAPSTRFLDANSIGNAGLRLFTGGAFKALVKQGLCIAPEYFTELANKYDDNVACGTVLRVAWEQAPVSSNRIELDSEKDNTGVPRVKLFWKKPPEDRRTLETAVLAFGNYLAKTDQGRLKLPDWITQGLDYPDGDEIAGFHHMGGTRMASSAAEGIVDRHCQVFGMDNLFIGGSSVFPTGGHANPTYSIVQLALRLGDHLGDRLSRQA